MTKADALREIESLRFQLQMTRAKLRIAGTLDSHCAYCGDLCRGYVCGAHSDLPNLDPNRQAKRPRLTLVASAPASDKTGG